MTNTPEFVLDENLAESFTTILSTLSNFRTQITDIQNNIRVLERLVTKGIKQREKKISKSKFKGNKNPSGFAKPSKISELLCKFMELPDGSEVARTEVTQYLINYIDKKKLQNPTNKKIILPDTELQSLLGTDADVEINYFNIQKYMNQHFKSTKKNDVQSKVV
jgi:chromatin remodeling complex protein RSC6